MFALCCQALFGFASSRACHSPAIGGIRVLRFAHLPLQRRQLLLNAACVACPDACTCSAGDEIKSWDIDEDERGWPVAPLAFLQHVLRVRFSEATLTCFVPVCQSQCKALALVSGLLLSSIFLPSLLSLHLVAWAAIEAGVASGVQPDSGKMCAFWVAALTSALSAASGSDMYGRKACFDWLACYVYLYTGAPLTLPSSLVHLQPAC